MMPKWHLLFGFILSYVLIYFFNLSVIYGAIIFLSSIFIDLDHVLVYFLETKNLHPKKFWEYSMEKKRKWENLDQLEMDRAQRPHNILHGVEFALFLLILSFFTKIFLFILFGILFHLLCDLVYLIYQKEHVSFKLSQVWLWQRNKKRKKFDVE